MTYINERMDFVVIEGVSDALVITIEDIEVDPAGYEFVIGGNTYTGSDIAAVADGDDVIITCPILAGVYTKGVYEGYFKTLTKEQGVYEQFKLQLIVKSQYGN